MGIGIYKIIKRFFNERTNKYNTSLSIFTDEELDTEIKKRQFSKINDGDYVLAFGINGPEIMKVISKSEKVAYLKTKNEASYHRAYHEIICKISKEQSRLIMAQYIDKSALIVEIKKRIEHNTEWKDACKTFVVLAANQAIEEDKKILSIIDTLEVKEVDLEKEIATQYESNYEEYLTYEEFADIAKHFFELGLKTQKGE